MMKLILITIVLVVAYGFAVILLRRLTSIAQQPASLRDDLKRNEARLNAQLHALQEQQSQEHRGDPRGRPL